MPKEQTLVNRDNSFFETNTITRKEQVKKMLQKLKLATNRELSERLGLPINSITGRMKELRDEGEVEIHGNKYDKVTDRTVTVFRIKFKTTLFE